MKLVLRGPSCAGIEGSNYKDNQILIKVNMEAIKSWNFIVGRDPIRLQNYDHVIVLFLVQFASSQGIYDFSIFLNY